ncbi:MAG: HlyD family secretion protein [Acidobacteria bacterium]|nr:MAG: HlyD family secretion protein [Acidobacteriota bacterium]
MANEEQNTPPKGLFERKPWLSKALRVLVVLALIGAALFWWQYRKYENTDDAQVDGHIYPISARVSGHVVKVNFEDGEFVKAGTVLVEIDSRDYQVAVARAKADYMDATAGSQAAQFNVPISQVGSSSQIQSAESGVLNAEAGVTAATKQVEEAEARLTQAQANAKLANADLARYATLVGKKEISQQLYDQASAASTSANATVTAAAASVRSAQEVVKQARARLAQAHALLANAKITPKQIAATEARARAGEAQAARSKAVLEQAELNLSYTKIVAPVDGIVGNRSAQVGQNVQVGQEMLSIVPLNDVWVTANFKETQLEHMRPGQHVEIEVDAIGGKKIRGTVTSVGGATGARFSLLPPENATGNYVKVVQRVPVRIDFDDRNKSDFNQDGRLRPGLSVIPDVRVR